MLAAPDETVHRTKIADWLELKALSSPNGRVGFGTLVAASAMAEDEQLEDIGDQDQAEEQFVLGVQWEIERRLKTIGDDYPFRVDDKGRVLQFIAPMTQAGSVYLFCLFLSHAFDHTIVPKKLAPKITNTVRDLFQACATVAAGGYVEGPSMSFGFPRPDGVNFLKALHNVYKLFGDGKPHKRPRAAAPKNVKDSGIDVIAWRRAIDNLPGTLYLVGQVASGADWVNKSVVPDRKHFHKYWFEEAPGSQPIDAMFIPFGLEPEDPKDGTSYEEVLKDFVQGVAYKYGNLFYRDRVAKFLAHGLRLVSNGEEQIQRVSDIGKIIIWVNKYTEMLRAKT